MRLRHGKGAKWWGASTYPHGPGSREAYRRAPPVMPFSFLPLGHGRGRPDPARARAAPSCHGCSQRRSEPLLAWGVAPPPPSHGLGREGEGRGPRTMRLQRRLRPARPRSRDAMGLGKGAGDERGDAEGSPTLATEEEGPGGHELDRELAMEPRSLERRQSTGGEMGCLGGESRSQMGARGGGKRCWGSGEKIREEGEKESSGALWGSRCMAATHA